jgi:hypothetical protein
MMPFPMPNSKITFLTAVVVASLAAMLLPAGAAAQQPTPEDRYIAARDAAIARISAIKDAEKADAAAKKIEPHLQARMVAILGETKRAGYGPAVLNADTFSKGDEGFGMLDGLRMDSELGANGEKAGQNGTDGNYVEPRSHIIVTTQTLFARWLRGHRDWWDKGLTNVPQQIDAALRFEGLYTQAIPTDSAVISFGPLPIAAPAGTISTYAILGGRTQSEVPDDADEVFVAALADGKVYIAYGSIAPKIQVKACTAARTATNKQAAEAYEKLQRKQIDKKTYDKFDGLREQAEDVFKRCFTKAAPEQPAFAEATRQAEALLAAALGR